MQQAGTKQIMDLQMDDLDNRLNSSFNLKAKSWSDFLGYHSRVFFFLTLSTYCFGEIIYGGSFAQEVEQDTNWFEFLSLLGVGCLTLVYAIVMIMFVLGLVANFLNISIGGSLTGNWISTTLGILYAGFVGLIFWQVGRLALSRLIPPLMHSGGQ